MDSETAPGSFRAVMEEDALPDNRMEIVEVQGQRIVLIKRYGKVFALHNTCPHLGGSLGLGVVKGNAIICPLHHWSFDISSGQVVEGIPDEKVAVYGVKLEEGKIWVKFP